jgi:hypothetical protein
MANKAEIGLKIAVAAAKAYKKFKLGQHIAGALDRRTRGQKISDGLKKYWRNKKKAIRKKFK